MIKRVSRLLSIYIPKTNLEHILVFLVTAAEDNNPKVLFVSDCIDPKQFRANLSPNDELLLFLRVNLVLLFFCFNIFWLLFKLWLIKLSFLVEVNRVFSVNVTFYLDVLVDKLHEFVFFFCVSIHI